MHSVVAFFVSFYFFIFLYFFCLFISVMLVVCPMWSRAVQLHYRGWRCADEEGKCWKSNDNDAKGENLSFYTLFSVLECVLLFCFACLYPGHLECASFPAATAELHICFLSYPRTVVYCLLIFSGYILTCWCFVGLPRRLLHFNRKILNLKK